MIPLWSITVVAGAVIGIVLHRRRRHHALDQNVPQALAAAYQNLTELEFIYIYNQIVQDEDENVQGEGPHADQKVQYPPCENCGVPLHNLPHIQNDAFICSECWLEAAKADGN